MNKFDVGTFVDHCRTAARSSDDPQRAVADVVAAAIADQASVLKALPVSGDDELLLHSDGDLTIYRVTVYPGMQYPPHEHGMSAVIGVYSGSEKHVLWVPRSSASEQVRPVAIIKMSANQVRTFRSDAIHSITNRSGEPSAGLHVYLGDLSNTRRRLWSLEGDRVCEFSEEEYQARARQQSVSIVA